MMYFLSIKCHILYQNNNVPLHQLLYSQHGELKSIVKFKVKFFLPEKRKH